MFKIQSLLLIFLLVSCQSKDSKNLLFTKVSSKHSNLDFSNTITENSTLNILDYEYLYNGGGVGIGDFNSDGLPDLCFTGNMVTSRIYINLGNLKFKDITETSGFKTDKWCTGVSIIDINNDGKPDIHISTAHDLSLGNAENYFFINKTDEQGNVKFENLAQEMNLVDESYSMQAVWLDYDKDGDLDLFLANNSKEEYPKNNPFGQRKDGKGKSTDRLYRNNGLNKNGVPVFEDVSAEAGITIEGWSLGVVVLDINNDQYPDIYVANDFMSNDILYVNNGDGTFTNKITDYFKHQSHNSMGIDAADINNDGALDLLVLDMLPEDNLRKKTMFSEIPFDRFNSSIKAGYQPQYVRNVLQVSTPAGFSDLGYFAGVAATDWSWSPLIGDFDNDGLRDIYITNGYKKDITDMDFVDFNNSSNIFGSVEEKRTALVAQLKKMEGIKKSNFYFRNLGSNKFENTTTQMGLYHPSYSNGAVYADLDLDGDLDLIINNIDEPVLLFENKAANLENKSANYLRITFSPDAGSLGTKAWVYTEDETQYAEFYPHKGYLSSFEATLHFGLGRQTRIDSVRILWPDQHTSILKNISVNQVLTPNKDQSTEFLVQSKNGLNPIFEPVQPLKRIPYEHKESSFDDFKRWPLHFRSYSKPGPILAAGDINGDSLEDVFIGGTANNSGMFYLQQKDGTFKSKSLVETDFDLNSETSAALLFDADGDGDLDLYCANGSSEHFANSKLYQDKLYINDGNGNFTVNAASLPEILYPTNTILAFDYDNDGDQDLFVAGRLNPNNYPFSPRSYLLRNDNGIFTDVTPSELQYAGMITGAITIDIDKDGWQDLIVLGEWMPIQIYYNRQGKFQLDTSQNGLENSNGWWNCIKAIDIDGDGDLDFVAGNWGLNNPFKASQKEPIRLYAKDFDANGSVEPIFTYYLNQTEYIHHPRGTLTKQLPLIRRATNSYSSYGSSSFPQLFGKVDFSPNEVLETYMLASVYVENLGDGKFKLSHLPDEAQWSPIFDFEILDLNNDKKPDILAVGNFSGTEVLTGHYNAGNGLSLINEGNGNFTVGNAKKIGFSVPEEARKILKIKNPANETLLLIGLQNDSLKMFRSNLNP